MASPNIFRGSLSRGSLLVAAVMLGSVARGDTLQPTEQLDHIIDLTEGPRELALGLLALDLAPFAEAITLQDSLGRQLAAV